MITRSWTQAQQVCGQIQGIHELGCKKKKIRSLFSCTSNLKFSMSSNKREPPRPSWRQVLRVCYQQKPQTCSRQVSVAADIGSTLPEIFYVYSSRFGKVFLQSSYLVSSLWYCFGDSSLSVDARNLIGIHCMPMHPDRFRSFVILKEWCYRWTCTWSFRVWVQAVTGLQSLHSLPLWILIHTAPLCSLESFFSTISLKP